MRWTKNQCEQSLPSSTHHSDPKLIRQGTIPKTIPKGTVAKRLGDRRCSALKLAMGAAPCSQPGQLECSLENVDVKRCMAEIAPLLMSAGGGGDLCVPVPRATRLMLVWADLNLEDTIRNKLRLFQGQSTQSVGRSHLLHCPTHVRNHCPLARAKRDSFRLSGPLFPKGTQRPNLRCIF